MAIDTLGANALASNSVTTAKIANDAVTGAKIPADAVVAADIADGSITTAKLADNAVTSAKSLNLGRRNLVLNGGMRIAQRAGFNISTTGSPEYGGPDRFHVWTYTSSEEVVAAISQNTDVPSGQGFSNSYKFDVTTAESAVAADEALLIGTYLEAQNLQHLEYGTSSAKAITLSFWIKSNKTGTYIVTLFDTDNTRNISKSYTIDTASTWEKKTITFEGDTTGAFDNDIYNSLQLEFFWGAGTDYSSGTLQTSWGAYSQADRAVGQVNALASANDLVQFTGVQLEAGQVASDFEFLPFDVNLERCIRYYTVSQEAAQWGGFAAEDRNAIFGDRLDNYSNVPVNHRFPKRMRTIPTVTTYSLTGTSGACSDTGKCGRRRRW